MKIEENCNLRVSWAHIHSQVDIEIVYGFAYFMVVYL